MINIQTYIRSIDNTGVKKILCIRILGQKNTNGYIGDLIIGAVQKVLPKSKIKKSEIIRGVIVRSKKWYNRINGTKICFNDNAIILINREKNPLGTRIFGPIANEIRKKGFTKITTIASEIL